MSQQDVLDILEKAKKPLPGREIAKIMQDDEKHVYGMIRRLIRSESIKIIEIDRHKAREMFGPNIKRRLRMYYI